MYADSLALSLLELKGEPLPGESLVFNKNMAISGRDHKKIAAKIKRGLIKAADLCKISPAACAGNLGIPRSQMPQLPGAVKDKFVQALKDEGIKVAEKTMMVGQLKATQREMSAEKVVFAVEQFMKGKFPKMKLPIVVSSDGYVLDGHHRWAAMALMKPGAKMKVFQVDLKIRELLKRAGNFKGVEKRDVHAPIPKAK